jgi:hypothetical protein
LVRRLANPRLLLPTCCRRPGGKQGRLRNHTYYSAARPDIRLWKPRGWKDSRPDRFKDRFKGRFKGRFKDR